MSDPDLNYLPLTDTELEELDMFLGDYLSGGQQEPDFYRLGTLNSILDNLRTIKPGDTPKV